MAFTVALATAMGSIACQTGTAPEDPAALLQPAGAVRQPVLVETDDPRVWPFASYSVTGSRVEGDVLALDLSFSGGCAEHRFALVVTRLFLESSPVQVPARLAHDDGGDPCDAVVGATVRFDLRPVRSMYLDAYGGTGGALVLVVDGRGVRYDF